MAWHSILLSDEDNQPVGDAPAAMEELGFLVISCATAEAVRTALARHHPVLMVVDLRLHDDHIGAISKTRALVQLALDLPMFMVGTGEEAAIAAAGREIGALGYACTPISAKRLATAISSAIMGLEGRAEAA